MSSCYRLVAMSSLLAVVSMAGPIVAQTPDQEFCSAPAMPFGSEFGGLPAIEDVITIVDDLVVADLQVPMEINHTFVGDILLDLSHQETTVRLHDAGGGSQQNIMATFDDAGAPNGSEPYDCECHIQPSGPGVLADLLIDDTSGEWTLDIQDIFPFSDDGMLDRWCLQFYETTPPPPPPPVGNLLCTSTPGSGVIQAAWTNSIPYDSFEVFIDGEPVAVLPGFFFIYVSPPQSVPSLVDLTVQGVVAGIPSPARTCSVAVLDEIDLVECALPGSPIASELLPVVSSMAVAEDFSIGDLQVRVDITHTFIGDLFISLTSPSSTTVTLHDSNGGSSENLRLTYWEFGVPNGELPYDCECFMEPSGPGFLIDFLEESTAGNWTLLVQDLLAGDFGVLNEWCLQGFDDMPVFPVEQLSCASGAVPGTSEISWMNSLPYDEIDIVVNGVLETTLPGPFVAGEFSSYTTVPLPAPGSINLCVIPRLVNVEGPQRCCSVNVVLSPVEALLLTSIGGSGEVTGTWSNPTLYDTIEVSVNEDPPTVLAGSSTSFTALIPDIPSGVTLEVRGTLAGFGSSPPATASVMALPASTIEACSGPGIPISSTLPPAVDVITLSEQLLVLEAEVALSLSHTFLGDLAIDLFSPAGTQVRLHDQGGSSSNDILVLYTDSGMPNGSAPFDCGCLMQPSGEGGVGSLADLTAQLAVGDWTLVVQDLIAADEGTLHGWCLRVPDACTLVPPMDVTCVPMPGDIVEISWTNADLYDDLQVERDGVTIDFLPGDTTDYTDIGVTPGSHVYRIIATQRELTCDAPSLPCQAAFGITDVIYRGERPALIDSVAALSKALEELGSTVLVVDVLDDESIAPPESDVGAVWVLLGTYPDNHSLTFDEGLALAELHTGDDDLDGSPDADPTPVYIEGGDTWGFDAPTPFADYDGVENDTALDGDDSLTFVTGQDSMVGLNLGGGIWDAIYTQDQFGNDYTDRIQPAIPVPDLGGPAVGVIWTGDDGVDPFHVGVYYDSSFAPVIAQSFEFGGYDGDGAALAQIYRATLLDLPPQEPDGDPFRRGDVVTDGIFQLNDAIAVLQTLFMGAGLPSCPDAADYDDDGLLAIGDAINLLGFLFTEITPPPPAPGPDECGMDPTEDFLPACSYDPLACP